MFSASLLFGKTLVLTLSLGNHWSIATRNMHILISSFPLCLPPSPKMTHRLSKPLFICIGWFLVKVNTEITFSLYLNSRFFILAHSIENTQWPTCSLLQHHHHICEHTTMGNWCGSFCLLLQECNIFLNSCGAQDQLFYSNRFSVIGQAWRGGITERKRELCLQPLMGRNPANINSQSSRKGSIGINITSCCSVNDTGISPIPGCELAASLFFPPFKLPNWQRTC